MERFCTELNLLKVNISKNNILLLSDKRYGRGSFNAS